MNSDRNLQNQGLRIIQLFRNLRSCKRLLDFIFYYLLPFRFYFHQEARRKRNGFHNINSFAEKNGWMDGREERWIYKHAMHDGWMEERKNKYVWNNDSWIIWYLYQLTSWIMWKLENFLWIHQDFICQHLVFVRRNPFFLLSHMTWLVLKYVVFFSLQSP